MRRFHYAIAAAAAAVLVSGCRPAGDQTVDHNAEAPDEATSPTILPAPEPPLDRAALLIAAVRAASAAAAGSNDSAAQRALEGKRFELKLSFGCPTAVPPADPATAARPGGDSAASARLSARPDLSLDDPLIGALTDVAAFEAVEGFWIKRPWLLRAACPPPPAPAGEEAASVKDEAERARGRAEPAETVANAAGQRIAIAEFFTSTDTRAGRRSNRPFEAVVTAEQAREIGRTGFNLVLAGRLRALPNGPVIACRAADPERPPDCLISADFDQVRMEHPGTGAVLARWAD